MSWVERRPLTALAVLALTLRVACAAATEFSPLFPAYYYADAALTHEDATAALADVRAGRTPQINGSLSRRIQTVISLAVYRTLGPRPFAVKLLNAGMGALAVAAFTWAVSLAFSSRAAFAAGLMIAVWPSHIFYTSQNLKEAPVALLAYAALAAAYAAGLREGVERRRAAALGFAAGAALLGAGFYRSYVLLCLGAATLGALALAARRPPRTNQALAAAALLAALAAYTPASHALLARFESERLSWADEGRIKPRLIPVTYSADSMTVSRPTSPAGITGFRRARQEADRLWAARGEGRTIGTQIYPEAAFQTWLDVALYLPKGALTVLFMPLPGFYPLEGKLGRLLAAGENAVLLAVALAALAGAARGGPSPARLGLLAFFAAMTAGAALLEFDLGSASRHKLLYLPMLFPFAAEAVLKAAGREEVA